MKGIQLLAALVAVALFAASCGGDDAKNGSGGEAAGTTTEAQAEQPQSDPPPDAKAERKPSNANGDGGSSAADAERAAGPGNSPKPDRSAAPAAGESPAPGKKPKAKKPETPQEYLAALSPAKRRALHKDLYEQGLKLCYAYGPKELARSYNLTGSTPETIAQQYARLYEAATPTLILPYQQGCMAGFRKFARNPPKN